MTTHGSHRSARTTQLPTPEPAEVLRCAQCSAARADGERFCESCGHDHAEPATWSVEITADRSYYEQVGSGLPFPDGRPATLLDVTVEEITVGRRESSGVSSADVDLSGPLLDPGVSHRHAVIRCDAGSGLFEVVDLGSTNGTTIDDDEQPIEPNSARQLAAGDAIHVGAWTTIRISPTRAP